MFGSAQRGANAYAKVGIETGVVAASPHQLIVMLFDGALVAIATAVQLMRTGDGIAGRGLPIAVRPESDLGRDRHQCKIRGQYPGRVAHAATTI
jgi:hypothetical protein